MTTRVGLFCAAGLLAGGVFVSAGSFSVGALSLSMGGQIPSQVPASIPGPRLGAGASVTGAFEGWYYNDDGSRTFLVGYYNRNAQQEIDIPIGPNNRIEPGGPDLGQPTHFLTGRQWGMFTIPVPKDFKPEDRFTWTIVANGQQTQIPLRLNADYVMAPFKEIAVGNTPPVVRFEQAGKGVQGPRATLIGAPVQSATVSAPLTLNAWISDDLKYTSGTSAPPSASRQPVTVRWSKYRGPGAVTFEKPRPGVEKLDAGEGAFSGKATTTAKFAAPGDYVLHFIANDYSGDGGGGFGCCWTTTVIKVTVKP